MCVLSFMFNLGNLSEATKSRLLLSQKISILDDDWVLNTLLETIHRFKKIFVQLTLNFTDIFQLDIGYVLAA